MKIDTSSAEGRKLAIVYEFVKNGVPKDFNPDRPEGIIIEENFLSMAALENAYKQGKARVYWEIKELIEAPEFESKKIEET